MRHLGKLISIFVIAAIAVLFQFGLQQPQWAQLLISLTGLVLAISMFIEMVKTLMSGKYGVDLLAITAIIATLAVGEYWAAMIILLMLVGGDTLEDYAAKKANSELKALLENSPQYAHRIENGHPVEIGVEDVNIGDKLLVKPKEQVPVDGHILRGSTMFDESSLTGESVPVQKDVGDEILSGSINGDDAITMYADKSSNDSQYQRLIALVRESEAQPAHFVRLADRYAVPFTLIAYVIAGIAWYVAQDPIRFAEVLVVASPCPLILAAPVAMVSGMSRSSRNGIVVKTGDVLEKLAQVKTFAFDKTGTITQGVLQVNQVLVAEGNDKDELLRLAASLEQNSSHILARSLVNYVRAQGLTLEMLDDVQEVTGNGLIAKYQGYTVKVGKRSFVAEDVPTKVQGQTAIYVSLDDHYFGHITFNDQIRPEAAKTMQALLKRQAHILMLTGDKKETAQKIASQAGIKDVHAELLPDEKIRFIQDTPENEKPIVMVGDGVNDAPALAIADVGIAMGAHGATAASETATVVILKDDLSRVAKSVEVAADTMKVARQAVLIGIVICTVLMLIASFGFLPPLFGALLQEVVDTVSILWALKAR